MTNDVYIRISQAGALAFDAPQRSHEAARPGPLVFIDLEPNANFADLRDLSHRIPQKLSAVIVRTEVLSPKDVSEILRRIEVECPIATLRHPPTKPAVLDWVSTGDAEFSEEMLSRARATELEALLERGGAIWEPTDHHYRLPSGQHSAGFVRLADAIREPRDAEALALWTSEHLRDGVGIVADSSSLTGVVLAMQNLIQRMGETPGPAVPLENYPRTQMDVERALRRAAVNGHVVALLSVSSSGRLRDRFARALRDLEDAGMIQSWVLHVFLDRQPPADIQNVATWLPLKGQNPYAGWGLAEEDCPLCRTSDRARLFSINPTTFHGMIPSQVKLLVPDHRDALANRRFWEHCSATGAIGLHQKPDPAVAMARPRDAYLGVRFDLSRVLSSSDIADIAVPHLEVLRDVPIDLVLAPQHEIAKPGYAEFWNKLSANLDLPGSVQSFDVWAPGSWPEPLVDKILKAKSILVFSLGVVTGMSLQRALVAIQTARRDQEFELRGACLHARPRRKREWQTLENSFDGELLPAWISYLSERSPLHEESELLAGLDPDELTVKGQEFMEKRLLYCSDSSQPGTALFWGSTTSATLSPHSVFGADLDAVTTLAAVGSAMHKARIDTRPQGVPEWRVFEMPAIVRSYYDPLIIASVLRWLDPTETWWGETSTQASRVIAELLGRTNDPLQSSTLVCELALAISQGKVPESAKDEVRAKVPALLPINPALQGDLELAQFLLD